MLLNERVIAPGCIPNIGALDMSVEFDQEILIGVWVIFVLPHFGPITLWGV
jgi:hypothetical protein